ncbi:carboxylesterase [Pseudoxanthomonas kalamensis DSM 18571]|uniref:alpha/beta hydrolase n=1 Tax=Pseudoxanthomonas kalamensis TaxID=289483 RepID=UPI00139097FC|nr:alpha/beta hydrolase [Pseudoxanthomonas kalamensis]KAF1712650.1 carboxylesterase [Pseudoxanthomonas kalamensis DSM 18571]
MDAVELQTGPDPQWTVLWLHGLGADGNDFAPIVPELVRQDWPALRFVFPHAPVRAVTINNGYRMRAWYDIVGMDFATRADAAGIDESMAQVEALIERERQRGVEPSRLLLAGFSQGGAITLALGTRRTQPLAGLIALSTYLPGMDVLDSFLAPASLAQPVFMAHGSGDPVIPQLHAERSAQAMRNAGYALEWHSYPMAHQVCAEEIRDLGDWMSARFAS